MEEHNLFTVPNVLLDVVFEDGLLFLVLKNFADVPAYNVVTKFDQVLLGVNETVKISDLELFKKITYMAPRKEFRVFLDVAQSYFHRKSVLNSFTASITWEDHDRQRHATKITHNLLIYKDLGFIVFPK